MGTGKMDTIHFLCFFIFALAFIKSSQSLNSTDCGAGYRRPEYTDISVECGTTTIDLAILVCPVIYTGYNESLLVMNNVQNNPDCKGTLDSTANPPVVRFKFPLNQTNACGSFFRTTSAAGTGIFSDFSNIQTVNISGVIRSNDPTIGIVTYNAELKYFYSCAYPLEYLVNNTQIDVSASSIAVKDNNGSFISTLSLELFSDPGYTLPMTIPPLGIELRTNIYVQVKATNLTSEYNVLLDRCYASTSVYPTNSTFFNLFVSCSRDQMTTMSVNGESQSARFSFPAFRFLEQQNETVSTYYLHCITRLCERSTCSSFKQCNRKKREADSTGITNGLSDSKTISGGPIITKSDSIQTSKEEVLSESNNADASVGLGVAVGILALACIVMVGMGFFFYRRLHPGTSKVFHS
ncbi:zona pellucida-like domain-containing protein 1 [Anguilla anguilla]|uniref:zona pellucida-like domain-containing protein 1 n=1 Tax=Anguilla anguilla TaxID=7936 RepID=UPI0015A9B4D6|nr:zona pellucida-like domain-containing protein 1 [Anguilla anguilla]